MRRFIVAVTVFALVGLLTTGAFAQVGTPPSSPSQPAPAPKATLQSMDKWYGSELIGMDVKNPQGEELGKVSELVLDPKEAKIESIVISTGGLLGIGAKRVAVPWDQVKPAADDQAFVVTMTKEELQQAPSWEKAAEKTVPATQPAPTSPGAPGR
jgi:sporulation protein YlmC with PRC-barrel domain